MTGRTFTGSYASRVNLSAGDNPATIATGAALLDGLYGPPIYAWTVTNQGSIAGTVAIALAAGGDVSNASSAVITGAATGVSIYGAIGTVTNQGTISATDGADGAGVALRSGGTVVNRFGGIIDGGLYAVESSNAATLTNYGVLGGTASVGAAFSTGTISNAAGATIEGARSGIRLFSGGSVTNAGTISGGFDAVRFYGGSPALLTVDPGAVFIGTVDGGGEGTIELASAVAAGTLGGLGTQFINFSHVYVDQGANWTLSGGGTLAAGSTLTNNGALTLAGSFTNAGSIDAVNVVQLATGAYLTNASGGTITGVTGAVNAAGDIGTLFNAGTIGLSGNGGSAVELHASGGVSNAASGLILGVYAAVRFDAAGSITNAGSIDGSGNFGVDLRAGGTLTNVAGGSISGTDTGVGISAAAGSVANYGTIAGSGTNATGVALGAGGVLTNAAGGTITGSRFGILVTDSASLVNAGGISGANYYGVFLTTGGSLTNAAGGIIQGSGAGVEIAGAPGTLDNAGTITAHFNGVVLGDGGIVSNASGGTIEAGSSGVVIDLGTLINQGLITETNGSFSAVDLNEGAASVTNQAGGSIVGGGGLYASGSADTVVNSGIIQGTAGNGIALVAGGAVTNEPDGTISGTSQGIYGRDFSATVVNDAVITATGASSTGVNLTAGGGVTNQSGGTIAGSATGVAIGGHAGSVTNAGIITGTSDIGIELGVGGTVSNAATGTVTGASYGVRILGGAGTVVNAGTIAADPGATAVLLPGGYSNLLTVDPGAVFIGKVNGGNVASATAVSTLELAPGVGAGTLSGLGSQFVNFAAITVDAAAAWTLTADTVGSGYGITDSGALTNTGRLGSGITLTGGASLTNSATGTISGAADGVLVTANATITNAGSIAGGTDAILFQPGSSGRLIVDPGAVFSGTVDGGGGTLEVASGVSLSGLGSQFVDFSEVDVDAGGTLAVSGGITLPALVNNGSVDIAGLASLAVSGSLSGTGAISVEPGATLSAGASVSAGEAIGFTGASGLLRIGDAGSFAATVGGFDTGGTIDLDSLAFVSGATATVAAGVVTVSSGGIIDTVKASGIPDGTPFAVYPDAGGFDTDLNVLCFCAGSRIATPAGEVAVERLRPGDNVLTHGGAVRPIVWIGTGRVLATRGRRGPATPVIVRKGALAANVPNEDLRVTKGHSFYLDGVLIPVEFLVNHRSILWDDRAREVALYHIELATHDVLLANGAAAESYRDDGNRWLFQNANAMWDQPPKPPFAPVLTGGPVVDAVWRRLLDRAGPRPGLPLTDDDDLHLQSAGVAIRPVWRDARAVLFSLPGRPDDLRIVSRAGAPAELGLARDPRVLGVALRRIALRQGSRFRILEGEDASLTIGFHAVEPGGVRWTNGEAVVPAGFFGGFEGPVELMLHLGGSTRYPLLTMPQPVTPGRGHRGACVDQPAVGSADLGRAGPSARAA